jgi:hypothetical protein
MTFLLCVNKRTLGDSCEQTKEMNYTRQAERDMTLKLLSIWTEAGGEGYQYD